MTGCLYFLKPIQQTCFTICSTNYGVLILYCTLWVRRHEAISLSKHKNLKINFFSHLPTLIYKQTFSNRKSVNISKSFPWSTTDVLGANTFPLRNQPPYPISFCLISFLLLDFLRFCSLFSLFLCGRNKKCGGDSCSLS